jgi:hypothetical protein
MHTNEDDSRPGRRKRGRMLKSARAVLGLAAAAAAVGIALFALRQGNVSGLGGASASKGAASTHSVTLSWQASPGARFYYVYRSTTSGSHYQKIGSTPRPSFRDAPVPSGAVFYYVVTSVADGRESPYSSEIKAVVP